MNRETYRRMQAVAFLKSVSRWTRELRMVCKLVHFDFSLRITERRTGKYFEADMRGERVVRPPIKVKLERIDT